MRILVHSGFFDEVGGGYVLTSASMLLLKDNPMTVRPFLLAMLDPVLTNPWHQLSTWFRNDQPTPFHVVNGVSFWEYGDHDLSVAHFFNDAMASDARLVSSVLINECKGVFEGLESIVDVGGGRGTLTKFIVDAFLHMECIVLDLPHWVEGLKGSENLKYVGGDMFQVVPAADAILLKWILHDWSDDECLKILEQCKEAITSDEGKKAGKVIIIDMVVENTKKDKESTETQFFFDLEMMVVVTGKERNEKEWAKLFVDAGFSNYKVTPCLGLRSLIEVYP